MLTLNDGRNELWQWDTGRVASVEIECDKIHFANLTYGKAFSVEVINSEVTVPDELLQSGANLYCWAYVGNAESGYTKKEKKFEVLKRPKPSDYVFTPTEQLSLQEQNDRIDALEEAQDPDAIKNAVEDYLKENPVVTDEKDPTVPNWAKQPEKPKYTAKEVGALPSDTKIPTVPTNVSAFKNDAGYLTEHQDLSGYAKNEDIPKKPEDIGAQPVGDYALKSEIPSKLSQLEEDSQNRRVSDLEKTKWNAKSDFSGDYNDLSNKPTIPTVSVQSVNGKTGEVELSAEDVGALPQDTSIPSKTSDLVNDAGFITIAVASLVNYYLKSETYSKNETYSRTDVDELIGAVDERLNAFFDTDDTTLDQLSEIVDYIKSNKSLIEEITTTKVSVSDIIDNLTTSVANKPLSASQGVVLKGLVDRLSEQKLDITALNNAINQALAQAKESGDFDGKNGSDANVTPENIEKALGYTPAKQESVDDLSEKIVDLGGVTDYIKTEAERVADLILQKTNANCLIGAFLTDIHRERNQPETETAIIHAGMGISEIRKITPLDFVANLGDNGESEEAHKFIYGTLYNAVLGTDSFWLRGNHEGSAYNYSNGEGYEYLVTDDEVYKFVGVKNKGHVVNVDDKKGMYGYKDYEDLRLRIIYLNTSEIFENSISSETPNVIMTTTQINWLQNTALDFSGKTDIDKWKVLILSHAPLDWNTSTQQAVTVLDNYVSSGNGAKIIGNIHGHLHNCNVGTIGTNKIARFAIPQVCADRYNEYSSYGSSYAKWGEFAEDGTTPIYYYKGKGNATDTMFCVVVTDCENEKFYAITFGATTATTEDGSYTKGVRVREISFDGSEVEEPDTPSEPDEPTVNYTNQIKESVDVDGSAYVGHNGEDGYSAGYRVNSGGVEEAVSGMCVTGYIYYTPSQIIRLKNATVNGAKSPYIAQYNQDKTFRQVIALDTTLIDDGTGVLTGSISNFQGWLRFTCGVIDDTSILTLDEEII